jgi:hypothetical protein
MFSIQSACVFPVIEFLNWLQKWIEMDAITPDETSDKKKLTLIEVSTN